MKDKATKMNIQAIAQHLNLAKELILEVQEWTKVLWVRIRGMRPKFVSKKVVVMSVFEQIKSEWTKLAKSSISNYLLEKNASLPADRIEKAILSSWNELVKDCRAASKTDDLICHIVGGQVKAENNQVLPFVKRLKGYFAKAKTQRDRQINDWYYGAADEESF